MHNQTRLAYNQFLSRIAQLNGVADATQKFAVEPSVEQRLVEKVQESSPFLSLINSHIVDAMEGEKVHIGVNSTIAGRTDTSGTAERQTRDIKALSADKYRCEQTNYDTHIRYATLDSWRHRPEFQTLLRAATSKQIARDRLMIGFNGTSAAATTNRTTNPLLQDVNKGWLQQLRDHKASAVMSGKKIGGITGHDYKNIDAAVYDAAHELIEPWYQDGDLVLIAGRKLITDKYLALIGDSSAPTERNALEKLMVSQLFGGLRTLSVPFFPDDAFLITPLSNLSIYTQRNTTRLAYLDNPRKDRIEEYRSLNEAYVIEDYDACCLVECILVPKADGSGWE